MLMQEMKPELAAKWKAVWQAHRDRLTPNRKTGAELAAYLTAHYPTRPLGDEAVLNGVALEILENAPLREKLPQGAQPEITAFEILNTGSGTALYTNQDAVFAGCPIIVGIDLRSGCCHAEGSSALWDELCAFQGLDDRDLENWASVVLYLEACKRIEPIR